MIKNMEEEYQSLEEIRAFCSKYIRENIGEQYDITPWLDKLNLYSVYKELKKHKEKYEKIYNSGQNEQETKT